MSIRTLQRQIAAKEVTTKTNIQVDFPSLRFSKHRIGMYTLSSYSLDLDFNAENGSQ